MKHITSAQNPQVKFWRQLASQSKARREHQQTIFEGVHVCEAYLAAKGAPLACFVAESAVVNTEVAPLIARLQDDAITVLPDTLFRSISGVENGVGVAFVVAIPESAQPPALASDALLIDGVQDPGNLGALLRTAVAAGVRDIYLSASSASAWSPKAIRAGMGAHVAAIIYENCDLSALIQGATVPVYATSLAATNTLYEKDLTRPGAWLFGNEGAGVSEELIALCGDNAVIIPQASEVESLNVAAAAAVCLFEQSRQRLAA